MRLDHDDPRLMDYVLGELEEGEAREIAAALEDEENRAAKAAVDELRAVADATRRILTDDDASLGLSSAQRQAIVEHVDETPRVETTQLSFWRRGTPWLAIAAALAMVAAVGLYGSSGWDRLFPGVQLAAEYPAPEEQPSETADEKAIRSGFEVHDMTMTYSTDNLYAKEGIDVVIPENSTDIEVDNYNSLGDSQQGYGRVPAPSPGSKQMELRLTDVGGDPIGTAGNGGFDPSSGMERPYVVGRSRNAGSGTTELATLPSIEQEETWVEYNVGNLTGQQELASNRSQGIGDNDGDGLNNWRYSEEKTLVIGDEPAPWQWQWDRSDGDPTEIVGGPGTETYVKVAGVKPFTETKNAPLSTFSIDVDTAAYSNVRRFLNRGQLPPPDAVRIEEMINYFAYSYPQPTDHHPFAMAVHGAPAPWDKNHRLVRIGVKGKEVAAEERPPANLVFLLDVSGSMGDHNKLPLVKESMKTLLNKLTPRDKVGIVTYAGDARKVLDLTPCSEQAAIIGAIDSLRSGGSTNGGGGIMMAYDMADAAYDSESINRVILATDGDFNVGNTSHGGLMAMIEARAKSGVFLTTLGFGMGNLKDSTLEQLADRGNGNYAYIDTHAEARRALGQQLSGTLHTIAKDVKIQVEFNPARVSHYRLLGYENRALAKEDFNDDTKDAGEIGAGHTVTALYEIIPRGTNVAEPGVDPLKYSETAPADDIARPEPAPSAEWLTVKMRYKQPAGSESTRLEVPLTAIVGDLRETDPDFRFASAVAAFGQVLRNPNYRHPSNFDRILDLARSSTGGDPEKEAFLDLVVTAKTLSAPR